MHIETPVEITEVLYEGELTFSEADLRRARETTGSEGPRGVPQPPRVRIGKPYCWPLSAYFVQSGKSLPPQFAILATRADFYLVRVSWGYQPPKGSNARLEWARFTAYLHSPGAGEAQPVAFDLYPKEIYDEKDNKAEIHIGPSLSFADKVEASLGKLVYTIALNKLEPVVVGEGAGQSDPNWDFEPSSKRELRGDKFMYLVVEKPKKAASVRATLALTARVKTRRGILGAHLHESLRDRLSQAICP
jgi:hypothetical protein